VTKHPLIVLATVIAILIFAGPFAAARRIVTSSPKILSCAPIKKPAQAVSLASTDKGRNLSGPLMVGNIVTTSVHEGCGCRFQLQAELRARSNRYFFIADQYKRAWMNIDGQDLELRLAGSDHMSLKSRKGQSAQFRFVATGINVGVTMLVTRTSTYEVDYEPARYAVTVHVSKGNQRRIIKTTGSCGC